ncbi:MAG: hypothetical protein ACI4KF_02240 [Huintestinicola sp.]
MTEWSSRLNEIRDILGADGCGGLGSCGVAVSSTGERSQVGFLDGGCVYRAGIEILVSGDRADIVRAAGDRVLNGAADFNGNGNILGFSDMSCPYEAVVSVGGHYRMKLKCSVICLEDGEEWADIEAAYLSGKARGHICGIRADSGKFIPIVKGVISVRTERDRQMVRRSFIDDGISAYGRYGDNCGVRITIDGVDIEDGIASMLSGKEGTMRIIEADMEKGTGIVMDGYGYLSSWGDTDSFGLRRCRFVFEKGRGAAEAVLLAD